VRRLSSRNQLILDSAGQGICGLDRAGRMTFVNRRAAEMLGGSTEELIGASLHDRAHALREDGSAYPPTECVILRTIADGITRHEDGEVFWRADATSFAVEYTVTPIVHGERVVGAVVSFADISRRKEAEKHLRQAALVIENTPDCVMITDASGLIQSVNPAFLSRTGYALDEVLGRSAKFLQSGHQTPSFYAAMWQRILSAGQWQGEIWNRRKNGEIYPEWLSIKALKDDDGRVTNYVAIYSDVATHQEVQARLHHLAYYDPLTGLPNRQLFTDRLGLALAQAQREHALLGLIFVDLDRFKTINDTLGHSTGDRLLQQVGARLRGAVRQSDTIARIGGDEFTVILPGLAHPEDAAAVARKIVETLDPPLRIDQQELFVTASLGISLYPHDGDTPESLIGRADIAMYRAKDSGRNNYQFYRPDMSAQIKDRLTLESDLRRALNNAELYFLYQPQFDIRTGRLVGVEALARWRHPEMGEIPPSTFIPIAEDIGLIGQLGRWGLKRACREAREWVGRDDGPFRVAVNLSAHQLQDAALPRFLARAALDAGIPPGSLALELTESVLMDGSPTTESTLRELTDMGVEIAIDDFGTGYSSLSYITRFAIDRLKIDRSFMRQIPSSTNDNAIAAMIIAVAHASNMRVTAEGVENRAQLDFLLEQGCDEMQGYLVGVPVPPAEITRMLDRDGCANRHALLN
jgi:diguanylate cyclase (GGDEF)-like protein/PAS domain S-box-containing protein